MLFFAPPKREVGRSRRKGPSCRCVAPGAAARSAYPWIPLLSTSLPMATPSPSPIPVTHLRCQDGAGSLLDHVVPSPGSEDHLSNVEGSPARRLSGFAPSGGRLGPRRATAFYRARSGSFARYDPNLKFFSSRDRTPAPGNLVKARLAPPPGRRSSYRPRSFTTPLRPR